MANLKIFRTSNNVSFFTRNQEKALVRLQQVDKESKEVKDLGFGFKAKKENKLIVVTSSSTLPEGIQEDEIVVDQFCSKSKNWNYKTKPQDQVIVESIQEPQQHGIRYLSVTGGDEEEFFCMDNKDDIRERTLSAFAFEDKEIIKLQFENKQGIWHFTRKSKEDFDVKKAKGAPIIYKDRAGSVIVIGVLSTNSSGQLYPVLFTKDFDYTRKLKLSITKQTESLPVLEGQTAISTDDVFTNVTIQRVRKDQEQSKSGREEFDVFQASSTTLKKCSEMFIWPENDDPNSRSPITANPKFILLTGKPGIGKSEFCRKMSRDWAKDGILDFKFLFLLTYRQLSLLGYEELDLCDILNRSPLLDEQSMIEKGLLQYMIENPEKVLIIFDGYDEYGYRTEITGDFETKYPNDRHKMPVPAMIAKIMKGNILKESVVVISSRPEEAQELKIFPFDVKCEIHGFSPLQVQEYIQKYFKEDESIKKKVLEHIKMNEILLSFGHIPVMCYLMCYYLKWHMTQSKNTGNLPNTRSELYHEVIKVFITRHFSKYKKMTEPEVEEILHKLAELSIYLMGERKIIFTEEDMKRFKFSQQEITNLKKSGLFDCCPGVKKSPFDKPPLEFVFSHLTMQEFLCALGFVEKKQLPEKEGTSKVIWTFMAGLLRRKNDEKLMDQLIEKIKPQGKYDYSNRILTLHCLYEYRDDELSKRVINKLHDKYCDSDGTISFYDVNDLDCLAIRYFLYIVQLLTVKQATKHLTSTQSFIVNTLSISISSLSPSGVSVLCESLSNYIPFVTGLWLRMCRLDDECVKIIAQTLNKTTINNLSLEANNITDEGVMCLCDVVSKRDCPVEVLNLWDNDKISDQCKISVRKLLQLNKPNVKLTFRWD